jgi:hypothetical protein
MLWLFCCATFGSASAANPHCLAALDKSCSTKKGTLTCDSCLKTNNAALKAAGCRRIDEEKYCGDSPKPVPPVPPVPPPEPIKKKCWRVLEKECAAEQKDGEAKCDQCVEAADRTDKLNCSHVEELKFCDKAPQPTPVPHACELQLIAACAPVGGNKGSTAECDACIKKNAAKLTSCQPREELSWCAMAPEPRPVADECERELKKNCGPTIKTDPDRCEECVKKLGATENCTRREEATFCGGNRRGRYGRYA